jgi:integrase
MSIKRLADGRFQHWWRDPDGRGHAKIFATRREAADHEAEIRVAKNRGGYAGQRSGAVTLRKYAAERWLPHVQRYQRPATADTYGRHLRNWVLPMLGSMKLAAIRRADCQAFATYLHIKPDPLAPATVGTVFAVLRSCLQLAVNDEILAANPCARVRLPRPVPRVLEPLSAAQVAALASAITPRYEAAVWLAAGCGLREGEALGLLASRIDFLHRRVRVAEQMQSGRLSPLKTAKSARVVPADDMVLGRLAAHLKRWPAGPDGLLITNRLGGPVARNSFGHCWREAVKAAGLPQGTRFHDLRHFYASVLIAAGLNVKVVQSRLGHATAAETLETYAHLWPDDADVGRGAIEAMFAAGQPRSELTSS